MNIRVKRSIQILLVLVILAALAYFVKRNLPVIKEILIIRPSSIVGLVLLALVGRWLAGLRIKILVETFDVKLSFMEYFGAAVVTNFYNCFFLKGGVALTSLYLKNKYKLDYARYVSLSIGAMSMVILSSGIVGLLCSAYGWISGSFNPALAIMFACMLLVASLIMILPPNFRIPSQRRIFRIPNTFLECWDAMRHGGKKIKRKLFILELCVLLLFSCRYWIAFRIFSMPAPFYVCLVLSPFNIISNVSSIIPSGYGVREAAVGFASKLAKTGFTGGVLATMANRVIMMVVVSILALFFSPFLVENIRIKQKEGSGYGKQ